MDDLPRNSNHGTPQEAKKITRVTVGEVERRQRPLGRRFIDTFVSGDDAKSVFDYILFDVVIPAAKDMMSDAGSQMIDRFLFPDGSRAPHRRTSSRSSSTSGQVNYTRFASSPAPAARREEPRARNRHDFDDLLFPTRAEALEVIDQMFAVIEKFEAVTVADLYEMVGVSPEPIDHKWGWTDIRGVGVVKNRAGYLLDGLKRPDPI